MRGDEWLTPREAANLLGLSVRNVYRLVDENRLPALRMGDGLLLSRSILTSSDHCHTLYRGRMTMLSFRVDSETASRAQSWADRLGLDRSALLRDALRRYLLQLASEIDATTWADTPLQEEELALAEIADWGPAEDWSDWADAAG